VIREQVGEGGQGGEDGRVRMSDAAARSKVRNLRGGQAAADGIVGVGLGDYATIRERVFGRGVAQDSLRREGN